MATGIERAGTGALRRIWRPETAAPPGRAALRGVLHTAAGRAGLVCALIVLAVLIAGSLRSQNPDTVEIASTYLPPGLAHPFGTDEYGRDELARVAAGGLTSLSAAALVMAIATTASLFLGTAAGLLGGLIDTILMRVMDVLLAIPSLVLALAVIGALGPGFSHLVIALTVGYIASFTKMTRAFALTCRGRADLEAARLAGLGWWRAVTGHVIPPVAARLTVVSTLSFGDVVISIAALSFLGLGVQPPAAEWGAMLSDNQSALAAAPWLLLAPGLAIVLTALAVNLIADALREGEPA